MQEKVKHWQPDSVINLSAALDVVYCISHIVKPLYLVQEVVLIVNIISILNIVVATYFVMIGLD